MPIAASEGGKAVKSRVRHLLTNTSGSIALIFGLAAPVLAGVAGIAVDYARYSNTVSNLQGLADGAAVAAVQGLAVANTSSSTARASVEAYVRQRATDLAWQKGAQDIQVSVQINPSSDVVEVRLSQEWSPMLAHVLFGNVKTPVEISSTARMVGTGKACIIGLNDKATKTLHMDDASRVTGNGCGIFSNSDATVSIMVDKAAEVSAQLICSAGGSSVKKKGNVTPDVTHDCPPMADPLAGRAAPPVGGCDFTDYRVSAAGMTRLRPGTYCGGLAIDGSAQVELDPGIYVIKDGPLTVSGTAAISGKDTGFYLTGAGARFELDTLTTVSLEAPVAGPLAGLLFFEDRNNPATTHRIRSSDARNLLGTIYLPSSELELSSKAIIASDSAYTALVVDRLMVREGPNVVLNSDYEATNVPVPPGLIGGKVFLTN